MGNNDVVRISPAATKSAHERWPVIDRALEAESGRSFKI